MSKISKVLELYNAVRPEAKVLVVGEPQEDCCKVNSTTKKSPDLILFCDINTAKSKDWVDKLERAETVIVQESEDGRLLKRNTGCIHAPASHIFKGVAYLDKEKPQVVVYSTDGAIINAVREYKHVEEPIEVEPALDDLEKEIADAVSWEPGEETDAAKDTNESTTDGE